MRTVLPLTALTGLVLVAACTSSGRDAPAVTTARGSPTTSATAAPTGSGAAPTPSSTGVVSEDPLPQPAAVTEVPGVCPYIDTPTASSLEGNKIRLTTVVSTDPVGCNFTFYADNHLVLAISTARYPSADGAYNAMVRIGEAGGGVQGAPGLVKGVDGVLYRTTFDPADAGNDWACTFAAGAVVVTVKTDQTVTSQNARNLAEAIAPKF